MCNTSVSYALFIIAVFFNDAFPMILSSNTNYDEDDLGDAYADESVIDQTQTVRRSKRGR